MTVLCFIFTKKVEFKLKLSIFVDVSTLGNVFTYSLLQTTSQLSLEVSYFLSTISIYT